MLTPALRILVALFLLAVAARAQDDSLITVPEDDSIAPGQLIPAFSSMSRAWDLPRNPNRDTLNLDAARAAQIRDGFELFTETPRKAPGISGNAMTCANCHLNAGQKERALPLVGVAGLFPELNKRAARVFSLDDRIAGCINRSLNATGRRARDSSDSTLISARSPEVLALDAYITWLSSEYPKGTGVTWRGHNTIPPERLIPVTKLDPARGKTLYHSLCSNCHGKDGQGVEIGDKKAGPLWGPDSWNDGAGAARVYTLAGMIRFMMPYMNPGSLTDKEAQEIALFIDSQPRPIYPLKSRDYPDGSIPPDAVYYHPPTERTSEIESPR